MSVLQEQTWTSGARAVTNVTLDEANSRLIIEYDELNVLIEQSPEVGRLRWIVTVTIGDGVLWSKALKYDEVGAAFGYLVDWKTPPWQEYASRHNADKGVLNLFLRRRNVLCLIYSGKREDGVVGITLLLDLEVKEAINKLLK